MTIPRARSAAEAHLYMDLHPCDCGEHRFARTHELVERDGDLASIYQGPCDGCETVRRFEMWLPHDPPPMSGYGGAEPSTMIDAGEFLAASEQAARSVPGSAAAVSEAGRDGARVRLDQAIAALDEVLKFIPAGADRVPAEALRSPRSVEMYAAEPGRFRRARLEAVREAYRGLRGELAAVDGGQKHGNLEAGTMNRFERKTDWTLTGDPFFPWETRVGGERWQIRMNEFPEEPTLYSLLVDGKVVKDFNDWPSSWTRPDLPPMAGVSRTAEAPSPPARDDDDPYLKQEFDEELAKFERQKKAGPSKAFKK